jgi:hypothetical protein
MAMRMVHVRQMWVDVLHRLMFVKMCMRLARGVGGRMTMVFIMHVRMGVAYGRMEVLMFMMLSHVQPHSDCHQYAISNCAETVSPNAMIAATLPMNGAVEKYALVRAVPRPRNASTNKTRLMP